jgi:hypothetical protein
MLGRHLGVVVLLAALAGATAARGAPRLRIVTADGPVDSPHKVFFGSSNAFYAVPAGPDGQVPPFRPEHALTGVDWRLYRSDDLRNSRNASTFHPGRTVRHRRAPEHLWWGRAAIPFICPDDLAGPLSSGRYVLRASHPVHGEDTLHLTVASILLIAYADEHTPTGFSAGFRIALVDPDLTTPTVRVDIETVGPGGRRLDGLRRVDLVRAGRGYLSPGRVRISSRVSPPTDERSGSRDRLLHIAEGGSLRISLDRRVFDFPVPLEEGLLVRRQATVVPGHEGRRPPVSDPAKRREAAGRTRRLPPLDPSVPPGTPFDIASSAGRGRRIKVWVGEPIAFAARPRPRDPGDLFEPTRWLCDVLWTLTALSPAPDETARCISPGTNRRVVARVGPEGLWGDEASLFRYPNDLKTPWKPGRYVLRAERASGDSAEVGLDVASFEVVEVRALIRKEKYEAAIRLKLTDPSEIRRAIPVAVEIVSSAGDLLDYVRGARLALDTARPGIYHSQKLLLSSRVRRPCRARYEEQDPAKALKLSMTKHVLQVLRNSHLRITLDGVVFSYPLPLSVYEIVVPGSDALGAGGRR